MIGLGPHVRLGLEFDGTAKREEVDVCVRHINAHDLFAHVGPAHDFPQPLRNFFAGHHDCHIIFSLQVPQKLHLLLRYHQSMAGLLGVDVQESKGFIVLIYFMARDVAFDDSGKNTVLHTDIVTPYKAVTIVLMATNKRKKRKIVLPDTKVLIVLGVVAAAAAVYGAVQWQHNRAVATDKNRFVAATNDVQRVADAVVAAVGPPADRKDGGKCSYVHQEFGKGPLTCTVYSYLASGVSSPDQVNAVAQKVDALPVLHGTPWQFKAVTEKPHQFVDGVNYSDNFVPLKSLFDTETKTSTYKSNSSLYCALGYLYHNSVSTLSGYPNLISPEVQTLFLDIDCSGGAKAPHFQIEN